MRRPALFALFLVTACGSGERKVETVEGDTSVDVESVEIRATIVAYHVDMIHFEFDDGTGEWLDGTELEVISPDAFVGKQLFICHQPVAPEGSLWRDVGKTIRFQFKEQDLDPAGCAHVQVPEEAIKVEEAGE